MADKIREIALDTETTGLSPESGDRVVEIGCVELLGHAPTGKSYHVYINPERAVPEGAFNVHKLTDNFLADKPKFAEVADGLLAFVGESTIIAHNASFDIEFLNMELKRCGRGPLSYDRVLDTLELARRKLPHLGSHRLDALCKYYGVDNSERRDAHGGYIDARILAEVYIELIGGKEVDFFKSSSSVDEEKKAEEILRRAREPRPARDFPVPPDELALHEAFMKNLGGNPIWKRDEAAA